MEDKDRFVDELLDSALAQQRRAEPRAGFESRILQRVSAVRNARASSRKSWVVVPAAAATAAVLIAAIYVAPRRHHVPLPTPQARNTVSAPAPREKLTTSSVTTPRVATTTSIEEPKRLEPRERKLVRRVEAHRWPSQFPTPAPLTAEEKALVQYVRETPPQVLATPILEAEFSVQRVNIKPLKIAPLKIKPLGVGPAGKEIQ